MIEKIESRNRLCSKTNKQKKKKEKKKTEKKNYQLERNLYVKL